jgi:hypothetical protein
MLRVWGSQLDSSGSGQDLVAGCDYGNESSDFIKDRKFLASWATVGFSRRTLLHGISQIYSLFLFCCLYCKEGWNVCCMFSSCECVSIIWNGSRSLRSIFFIMNDGILVDISLEEWNGNGKIILNWTLKNRFCKVYWPNSLLADVGRQY